MAEEYLTVAEARELLGVSRGKMTKMIKDGVIATVPDPLDSRVKLVKKIDIEKLKIR